jgi:hypothetical protein
MHDVQAVGGAGCVRRRGRRGRVQLRLDLGGIGVRDGLVRVNHIPRQAGRRDALALSAALVRRLGVTVVLLVVVCAGTARMAAGPRVGLASTSSKGPRIGASVGGGAGIPLHALRGSRQQAREVHARPRLAVGLKAV